jgi:alkanesulfonate monooxygenase SsuD/methylene tetrahydromethanopterin reductase-like flavin-dependent oxidoreductase (luciferase family)
MSNEVPSDRSVRTKGKRTGIWMRVDVRGADIAASSAELCSAAIEQAVWAEDNGLDAVQLAEHHGAHDGYLPSPLVLAAAIAARTRKLRLHIGALLLPLHEPLRTAEDLCVLDNISNGRIELTVGVGYVPSEFAMFGVDLKDRAPRVEEAISAIRGAFSGKPFKFRGREVFVGPRPVQIDRLEILLAGALKITSRRGARLGDGLWLGDTKAELLNIYYEECRRIGKEPGRIVDTTGYMSFHVSNDPERDWARVGPHFLHEMQAYGRWAREGGNTFSPFREVDDIPALRKTGVYAIMTPDECLDYCFQQREAGRQIWFNPLCGGLHPDIAWESLELMASQVLPRFNHIPAWQSQQ